MTGERPIFVVGFQRSGTTLLQSILGSHPRIAGPPEIHFVFRIVRMARTYGDLADDDNLRRALHDAIHPPVDVLSECGFDDDRLFERARVGERTMRGLFKAIMDDFAERQGKPRWSEKSPLQGAADVFQLFPEAQVLHIVRDPRDAIASALGTPWTTEDALQLAQQWRSFTIATSRQSLLTGPDHVFHLRYEDLTRDPETVLRLVFAFLDEEFDDRVLQASERSGTAIMKDVTAWQERATEAIAPAAEGGWRSSLSPRDRAVVQAIVHRELAVLGYQPAARRSVLAGHAVSLPERTVNKAKQWRMRRALRDPSRYEEAMRDYMAQQASAVAKPKTH